MNLPQLRLMHCSGTCLGYLTDAKRVHRHALYWPADPIVDRLSSRTISLGNVLASKDINGRKLSVADSRRLGHSLALSVLRLYDTPWLPKRWDRNSVTLFTKDGAFVAKYPFVSTEVKMVAQSLDSGYVVAAAPHSLGK